MERGSITKWLFLAVAAFLFLQFGLPRLTGSKAGNIQPLPYGKHQTAPPVDARAPAQLCTIDAHGMRAEFSSRGGSLRGIELTGDARYRVLPTPTWFLPALLQKLGVMGLDHSGPEGQPIELVTTSDEARMPLRTDILPLDGGASAQVKYDDLDWKLTETDGKRCVFTYADDTTSLAKTIAATDRPYELEVTVKIDNLADGPRKHRLTVEQSSYRTKKETEGHLGRQSEFLTETVAATTQKIERLLPSDFEPDDFKDKEFTSEGWRRTPGDARYVAEGSSFFTKIAMPLEAPVVPAAETQIEERWDTSRYGARKDDDPNLGHVYRVRLAYPEVELPAKGSATYKVRSFSGPKERDVLAAFGAPDVLDLGTFTPIAKGLIWYLYKLHGWVQNWGIAIILLTITVRMCLFPLSISQIKSSMVMRKLKPEMDAINDKYKDDAAQRGLAIQELWRKNNVTNPVLGCLPMLLQLPIWWALYRSLQTAVELYHTKFAWFHDLSAPDHLYIIPVVLGASSFIQQKLMPAQGDPQQQKMMLYMMPGVYTFMMLFLPSGLGLYMLTNTWLGIGQQVSVERYLRTKSGSPSTIEVREKTLGDGDKPAPALGKGKARVRG
jgi:YidC/Oxa1 family membrane protein insertase